MTQFQQSASVRTLDTSERAYPAPFLAIVAGLVAVLMTVAVISFAVDALPSDAAISGNLDSAAVDGYLAGLTAANKQHQLEGAAQAMQRPITATDSWTLTRQATAKDGWEAALIQPREPAVDTYSQRFITAD
jgi:hypothetical protein